MVWTGSSTTMRSGMPFSRAGHCELMTVKPMATALARVRAVPRMDTSGVTPSAISAQVIGGDHGFDELMAAG